MTPRARTPQSPLTVAVVDHELVCCGVEAMLAPFADTIEFEAGRLLGDRYVRLQRELAHAVDDLDDASAANLDALRADAEALIAASGPELDRVCAILAG